MAEKGVKKIVKKLSFNQMVKKFEWEVESKGRKVAKIEWNSGWKSMVKWDRENASKVSKKAVQKSVEKIAEIIDKKNG